MRHELHAEWTKLRTLAGIAWLLLAAVVLTVALGAGADAACSSPACDPDPAKTSLTGIMLGQAVIAVLAVTVVCGEYGTGMIRVSLAAMPRRSSVLAAKAVVLTGIVLIAGAAAVLGSVLVAAILIRDYDPVLRAAGGSVLYLVFIALLSLGIAWAVRDAAAAVGIVLGVLYLFPILTTVVTNPDWQRHLKQISPMNAGLAIQSTGGSLPIGPWAGLGVVAAWAAGAVLLGGIMLQFRDA
ncbi:MAG TPA: ABC transporter permease [Mycobacteriales bacterium]|nr:ABC transporter permease [Mycobacteriales bacterium]